MPFILLRLSAALLILVFSGAAVAGNHVVTSPADSGAGTLRQAIVDANATPKKDRIVFDLPGAPPHMILLANPLPDITERVTIAGFGNIVIDGSGIAGAADGLRIVDSDKSNISGLTIRGFSIPQSCNAFAICTSGTGIYILGSSSKNKLSNNRLLGNVNGVVIANGASNNSVKNNFIDGEVGDLEPQGGDPLTDAAFREDLRLVNGFPSVGILIDSGAANNKIQKNHTQRTLRGIGTFLSDHNQISDNSALAIGNQCFILLGNNNVVSQNSCKLARREAYEIFGALFGLPVSSRNRVANNFASRSGFGQTDIGQLLIQGGTDNVMEGNTLLDNFSFGIALFGPSAGNIIRSNTIDGVDRAAIFAGNEVADNILVSNSLRNYSETSGEGAILIQGNANFNFFFDNYIGVPGGISPAAIQVQGDIGLPATNNRFEENIHERTDVLWSFNEWTSDNIVCGPILINAVLDVDSQLITTPGLGNEVFEVC